MNKEHELEFFFSTKVSNFYIWKHTLLIFFVHCCKQTKKFLCLIFITKFLIELYIHVYGTSLIKVEINFERKWLTGWYMFVIKLAQMSL